MQYSAVWLSESRLKIVFIKAKSGIAFQTTRIGVLGLQSNYMIYSSDFSNKSCYSPVSFDDGTTSSAPSSIRYVNGNWGKHDPPVLLRGSAFDPGDPPLLGFTSKDELRLVFDKETNMPPVSTRDQIDKLFEYTGL